MAQQRSSPTEVELIPLDCEKTQPKLRNIYISVWISREVDEQFGRRARPILLSTLFGLASAAAVVLFVALALISVPLVGVLSAVALFAIMRHAQFRRVRAALVRGKRT
jgi:hypothetical protein